MSMRLYILRHGQTEWNLTFQVQGQTDIPLNENGRALAVQTGAALADVSFDEAFTSPLIRAKETAELVLKAASEAQGIRADGIPPIIADERLTEISFGVMEGARVRDTAGNLTDENFSRFFYDTEQYRPPEGGESFQDVIARTGSFLDDLKRMALCPDGQKDRTPETILISAHGCASRALLANITGCSLRDFWSGGVPRNCAVTIVDLEDGDWIIKEKDILYYDNANIGLSL